MISPFRIARSFVPGRRCEPIIDLLEGIRHTQDVAGAGDTCELALGNRLPAAIANIFPRAVGATAFCLTPTQFLPQSKEPEVSKVLVLGSSTRIMHRIEGARTMIRHELDPGDLLVIPEKARREWVHGIPPTHAKPTTDLPGFQGIVVPPPASEKRYILKIREMCDS